ncbi:sodium/sulphate symporter [Desulfitobacterium hafniense DCB-2]|uniref:Sodium/sulphate symporter n=1 Tax=Desulfitobacterium hafniense (strain DSM 10664 / DCB-2) TaxID=272564 RepID=B8FQH4_DESHD|nr:SLC13 family permease [Desulfitobacterium hafniense]ACL19864.1 sodium/sulphate symporter [Desulfitobacterium hafniense DCB-2]
MNKNKPVTEVVESEGEVSTKKHIYSLIGFVIVAVFWIMPPIEPLTPLGMKVAGTFFAMIVWWSTVGAIWPSICGLLLIGLSGYAGGGAEGFTSVFTSAFSNNVVLLVMFAMVLFGAFAASGAPKYIARWVLTRKVINGRPYVFMAFVFLIGFFMAGFTSSVATLIILWPITLRLMEALEVDSDDEIWAYFFVGLFLMINFGRPIFSYKGTIAALLGTYNELSGSTDPAIFLQFMILLTIMGLLFLAAYLLVLKFMVRPDVSKLRGVSVEKMAAEQQLPPIELPQKLYLWMIPIYIFMLVAPSVLPNTNPIGAFLETIGPLGVTVFWVVFFNIVHFQNRQLLEYKEVAAKYFNWGVFFMVPASLYGANALTSDATGFKEFLTQILTPILGGQSEILFIAILFAFALFISNFANNTAIALIMMPIFFVFCEQMSLNPKPGAMILSAIVFVTMLTPGASPQAALMFARRDIYKTKDIVRIGFPVSVIALLFYIFIGYPLAKILFL